VQHIVALSGVAVLIRHWFEIDLDDASMEHGVRIELRELAAHPHRGSESAAQLVTADRPLWRADLFDRLTDPPGSFAVAHYHAQFEGNEPCSRVWDAQLSVDPWVWLDRQIASVGAEGGRDPWPVRAADAAELRRLSGTIVGLAREVGPDRCSSPAQCYELTRDVAGTVQLMAKYLRRPELLDRRWTSRWLESGIEGEEGTDSSRA